MHTCTLIHICVRVDAEVDVDIERYFGSLTVVSKSVQVMFNDIECSYGTDLEIASPVRRAVISTPSTKPRGPLVRMICFLAMAYKSTFSKEL